MPRHRKHHFVEKIIFGQTFPEVDRAIDRPAKYWGRSHRKFFHTYDEAYIVGCNSSLKPNSGEAGILHVMTDKEYSKSKSFRKTLDWAMKYDRQREKQLKQWIKLLKKL